MSFAAVPEEERRAPAPLGRRTVPVVSRRGVGAYTVLACDDPVGPLPRPGQFYMLAAVRGWGAGEGERPYLPRAFSVLRATPPKPDISDWSSRGTPDAPEPGAHGDAVRLEFLLEAVGPGTSRLCELDAGDELHLLGPLGLGFSPPAPGVRPILCGGGVGVAPLAILEDALPGAVTLLGFRDDAHAEGEELFRAPRVATDDGSVGHHGLVTDLLADELDRGGPAAVYACGPPPMLEAVRRLCAERAQPAQLALEAGMACGYGACFGCAVPTKGGMVRLCVDGPVLDAEVLETALIPGTGHG